MKVFLSSTTKDLADHRQHVIAAIDRGDGLECACMERFGARDAVPAEFIARSVEGADVFVGIIGHLHGSCPPSEERSFTELEYEAAVRRGLPRLIFLAREDFSLPMHLVEPETERQRQKAFRLRVSAERIRDTFNDPADLANRVLSAVRNLERQTQYHTGFIQPFPPQPDFEHPYPLQENFTGRRTERLTLSDWFGNDSHQILALVGMGGEGKSALTWAWVQTDLLGLPLPGSSDSRGASEHSAAAGPIQSPDGLFWWSFYEGEADFNAFLDRALCYASSGQLKPHLCGSGSEKAKNLVALLQKRRMLLVLDGFERQLSGYSGLRAPYQGDTVSEEDRVCVDPNAREFIKRFVALPSPSRLLLTTRLVPLDLDGLAGCRQEHLSGLNEDDAEAFLRAQGVEGTSEEIREVCRRYGHHALALRLLAGLVAHDPVRPGNIYVVSRIPQKDIAGGVKRLKSHILELAYDALSSSEQLLLSQMAAFRYPVAYSILRDTFSPPSKVRETKWQGWMRGLLKKQAPRSEPEHDLLLRLKKLIGRGLVLFEQGRDRYDLHPIVRHYSYDRLLDKAGIHTKLTDYYGRLAGAADRAPVSITDFQPLIELFHHTVLTGHQQDAFRLFAERLQAPLLTNLCDVKTYCELIGDLFGEAKDGDYAPPGLRGRDLTSARSCLAHSYLLSGAPAKAIPIYEQVLGSHADNKEYAAAANASIQLAMALCATGELKSAEFRLRAAIRVSESPQRAEFRCLAEDRLCDLYAQEGRTKECVELLSEGQARAASYEQLQAQVRLALLEGKAEEALRRAREALSLADRRMFEMDRIRARWLIGWAMLCCADLSSNQDRESRLGESETYLKEALRRCGVVRFVELETDARLTLAQCYFARGLMTEAREYADDSLLIADASGYRLKKAEILLTLAQCELADHSWKDAERHLEAARDSAWCDGPPHVLGPVFDRIERVRAMGADGQQAAG